MKALIDKLEKQNNLSKDQFIQLLSKRDPMDEKYLFQRAQKVREQYYGNTIYIRGLIEISSYCVNDCYYCGIRCSNDKAERYRLTKDQILESCKTGYELGFRTFVLQGGEDPYYTVELMADIIKSIGDSYPDCAITLSIGERPTDDYLAFKNAGADRFLLRHETATPEHYSKLHPDTLKLKQRLDCIRDLKEIGYQVGTGFMVGSPYQTTENLAEDLAFIHELQPDMVGIGPYIPHKDTPFKDKDKGSVDDTLVLIAILRLMLPNALLPATTSLVTLDDEGRNKGFLAGANVVMPNLSPSDVRAKYTLYNGKKFTDTEAAESLEALKQQVGKIGYQIVIDRGDVKKQT